MTRKLVPILVALALGCPQAASALALGDLKVRSSLNEPLDAEIDLLSVRGEDLADLRAKLAATEEFQRAGVDRPYVLSRLRFKVEERPGGKAVLKVSTRQPVKEPFLNFLIELNWPQGRLVREYTALLDPPVYSAAASARVQGPVVKAEPEALPPPIAAPVAEAAPAAKGAGPAPALETPAPLASSPLPPAPVEPEPGARAAEPEPAPEPQPAAAPMPAAVEGYGPTRAGDTLWSIANRVRPDPAVSTQQMMVALLRANPDAFAMGNVNALKKGYVLKVPDRQAIDAVSPKQALADLRRQETAWEDYRQGTARTARPRSTAVAAAPAEPARKPVAEPAPAAAALTPPSRLEIVAAGTAEGGATRKGGGTTALKKELTVLQEDLDGRRQEIAELQSRLAEAEALIQDLRRLIKLKDETLAALQQQALLAQARAQEPAPVVEPASEVSATPAADAPVAAATGSGPAVADKPAPDTLVVDAPAADAAVAPAPVAVSSGAETPAAAAASSGGPATDTPAAAPVVEAAAPPAPSVEAPPAAPPPPAPVAEAPSPAPATTPPAPAAAPPAPAPVAVADLATGKTRSLLDALTASPTVLWGGLAGLLAVVGGLVSVRRRRPAEESPEPAAVAVPEEPSTAVAVAPPTVATVPEPSAGEPVSAPRSVGSRVEDFRAEDPMAEANVYLAYERFSQAEDLVREAIAAQPDRPEYRLKLLEIHHAAKNPAAFERDAETLRAAVGDDSPFMERARGWWADLSPGRALFAPVAFAAGAAAAAGPDLERTLRLSAEDLRSALDLAPLAAAPAGEAVGKREVEDVELPSGDVDFDLGLMGAEEPLSELVDFDLELGAPSATPAAAADARSGGDLPVLEPVDAAIASALAEATEALDLDLAQATEDAPAEPSSGSLDLDLEFPAPALAAAQGPVGPAPGKESLDLSLEPLSVSTGATPLAARLAGATTAAEPPGASPAGSAEGGLELEPMLGEAPAAGGGSRPAEAPVPAAGKSSGVPSLDLTLEPLDAPAQTSVGVPDEVLQTLTPRDAASGRAGAGQVAARAAAASPEVDFELDLDLSSGESDAGSFFLEEDGMGSLDEVGTKLDLARAYIDMGDSEGARGILGEVLSEGNDTQQGEARELLSRLAS